MRTRTGYSFRTAWGKIDDVIARLKAIGATTAPISDRNSTFGYVRWTKAAKAAGLHPVYGVELNTVSELGQAKPNTDAWAFFAQTDLRPLHDLIWRAGNNPGRDPSLLYTQALAAEGVFKIAGERLLVSKLPDALPTDFFFALSPAASKGLVRSACTRGIPPLASSENFYPTVTDEELYRVALGKRAATQTYPRHILSDAELGLWLAGAGHSDSLINAAFANRNSVLSKCKAQLKQAKLVSPQHAASLYAMCAEGAARLGVNLQHPVYKERLERELNIFHEKQFDDYFYLLADFMSFARANMVCGPARGSSCGSLACYLLGITTIDPIPYGLIFERFVDVNRMDLPDIDVDLSDQRRHLVFEYLENKYGQERVARLGTVGTFGARSAMRQAAISLKIPPWRVEKVNDSIIERSSGDSRVMNTLEDTLKQTPVGNAMLSEYPEFIISGAMEGHPVNASQHAAGVVITNTPIRDYVAVDARTRATHCDKKDAETLNLLKIDALGLTQLSVFERLLELIGQPPGSGFLEHIPLDDPAAFEVMNNGHYSGIFQFTGAALRSVSTQIKFDKLDDIVAMTALCRPGPLGSGGTTLWIKRRRGDEPVPKGVHPLLDELTAETYGVVIYQETVMRITRDIGNFSWADTAAIRKLMSNRQGNEAFRRFEDQFLAGAQANGLSQEQAVAVWKQIDTMGAWAFNKSHSVAYGILSYWCCYLKAHYPVEFAAATLDAEPEPAKQLTILRELAAEGVNYIAVDKELSTDRWQPATVNGAKMLVGPLNNIRGIGPVRVREIIDSRKTGAALKPAVTKLLNQAVTSLDELYPIATCIKTLHPDLRAINIITTPITIKSVQAGQTNGEFVTMGVIRKISPRDENESINIQKRGGRVLFGPTQSLNLWLADDGDEIYVKIDRWMYERLGRKIVEEGRVGRTLLAIKGTCPHDFRMVKAQNVRWLGEVAMLHKPETRSQNMSDKNIRSA